MTNKRTLIELLRSNTFAIYIAIASVIVQSFHSFYAFYKISSLNGTGWGIAQAVLFAVIVDCAVLFYTVRKNTKVTWMAAFVMVLINLYVYYTHLGLTFDFLLGALISFVIPVSNYFYSEEIDDTHPLDDSISKLHEQITALTVHNHKLIHEKLNSDHQIDELHDTIKSNDATIDALNTKLNASVLGVDLRGKESKMIIKDGNGKIVDAGESEEMIKKYKLKEVKPKGFAELNSIAQENQPKDKSLLDVVSPINTDRPVKP